MAVAIPALTVLAVLSRPTAAAADARLQRLIVREDSYNQLILTKSRELAQGLFAEDFYDTTATAHVLRKSDYLKQLEDHSCEVTSLQVTDSVYLIHGDTAVVTARFQVEGRSDGKAFSESGRSTDVWIWHDRNWWCLAAHSSHDGRQ